MLGIVVFVGQNMFCDAKHATKRATDDNWKRDVAGSNKRSFIYQVIDCYFVIDSFFRKLNLISYDMHLKMPSFHV